MKIKDETIEKMVAALEFSRALDAKFEAGINALRKHGFDYDNRFNVPATQFVKNLQNDALFSYRSDIRGNNV